MRRAPLWFWGTAAAAAVLVSAAALVVPYAVPGIDTDAEWTRAYLITVFCSGVMAVLFGTASALGTRLFVVRDIVEAGSVAALHEKERQAAAERAGRPYTENLALWVVAMGGFLIAIYFALWKILG